MHSIPRKLLSQNFLYSSKLVSQLVNQFSLDKNDLVIEIGPGKGIITQELVKRAGFVVAVEIDLYLVHFLQNNLKAKNFTLYNQDFLQYQLPVLPYKVFANTPFSIEGKVIQKLLENSNPPEDCCLVIRSELGKRLSSIKPSMFAALHKPWFDFSIEYQFSRQDFRPIPNVNAVLFRFRKKSSPLLSWKLRTEYQDFVHLAYADGASVRKNLMKKYQTQKVDCILHQNSISRKVKPNQLTLQKWIDIFVSIEGKF